MKFDDKKKSLEYLQGIFETANDAIISTNKEGIITSFNKKAEEMYGYSREEIMEKSILTLFAPREIARQKKGLEAFIAQIIEPGRKVDKVSNALIDDMISEIDLGEFVCSFVA